MDKALKPSPKQLEHATINRYTGHMKAYYPVLIKKIRKDTLLWISFIFAIASLFLSRPQLNDINWKTMTSLLSLMLIVLVYKKLHILDYCAMVLISKVSHLRQLIRFLLLLSFFSAMLFTNDVAILTLVPFFVAIARKIDAPLMLPVTLITLAANLGSVLTPFGNPQNLFLLAHYHLSAGAFFRLSLPITLVSFLLILSTSFLFGKQEVTTPKLIKYQIAARPLTLTILVTLFIFLGVFSVVPSWLAAAVTVLFVCLFDRRLVKQVDYGLLGTFLCFFIAVGDISRSPIIADLIRHLENNRLAVYMSGLVTSQLISNVPAAILLAKFTSHVSALFLGVNIGGLGTLVASMANLIAYKQYRQLVHQNVGIFLWLFSAVNFAGLLILGGIGWLLLALIN